MKLNQKYKESIIHLFQGMQSNEDLLSLINCVKVNVLNSSLPPIKLSQLTFYAFHCKTPRYSTFSIFKKNGTERKLTSPIKRLKLIQKCLNIILSSVFNPHKAIHGFIPQSYFLYLDVDGKEFLEFHEKCRNDNISTQNLKKKIKDLVNKIIIKYED